MQILQTVPSLSAEYGGPSRSVTSLSSEIATNKGVRVGIVSQGGLATKATLIKPSDLVELHLASAENTFFKRYFYFYGLWNYIDHIRKATNDMLIHDHGIWSKFNHTVAGVARKTKVPLMVSTRGMLEPWALKQYSFQKKYCLVAVSTSKPFDSTALARNF